MSGRPKDPLYWRKWRASHPEYRRRDTLRMRARRAAMSPEERRRSHGIYRPVNPVEPIPSLHQGHPLLEQALAVARRVFHEDRRRYVYDPSFDDLVGTVTLALLEGQDPWTTAHDFMRERFNWSVLHVTGCTTAWDTLND